MPEMPPAHSDAQGASAVHRTSEHDQKEKAKTTMDNNDLLERIHALETAQATQAAATAGMEATNAAATAGLQAAQLAAHAGTWAVLVAGSASLIVGTLLGMAIVKAKS